MVLLFLLAISCHPKIETENTPLLSELLQQQQTLDLFSLKKNYEARKEELSTDFQLYFEAYIDSYFNHPEESNKKIKKLIRRRPEAIKDSMMARLLELKESNHARLFEYKKAEQTCQLLMNKYITCYDSSKTRELINASCFWDAIAQVPKQKIYITGHPEIPIKTDKRGFWNINIGLADTTCYFIFDTGTGTSVITHSVAQQEGYHIIQLKYPVKAFTGRPVETNLAIAETITISGITFENVVFLVVDDDQLHIPGKEFPVSGIIGFPVIAALKELQIKNGMIHLPEEPLPHTETNMLIQNHSPIVATGYLSDTLLMKFDTGALKTNFQAVFYQQYKSEIDSTLQRKTIQIGSVGGTLQLDVFKTQQLTLRIGESEAMMNQLSIFSKELKSSNLDYHGNIGLDYLNHFQQIDISFTNHSISLH